MLRRCPQVEGLACLHRCGLVALWMAGALLVPPSGVPLERLVQVARERGFTAQGEMFSGELHSMTSLGSQGDPNCLSPSPVD